MTAEAPTLARSSTRPAIVRLGDVLDVIRGASPRPKGDPKYFGGDIPWVMISDVTREPGKYLSRTRDTVTRAGAEKSRYLPAGTLILSNSGTVCVPKILAVDGCIHDGFVAFPSVPAHIDKNYLYWFFECIRPSIIEANRQGITQVNLNTGIVKDIRLPLVPLDDQRRIVAEIEKQFSRLDEAVANLKRVKGNLKRYKAAVLKAAVEGRLVSTEAELARREGRTYETGAQLLQRILETRRTQWKGRGKYKEPVAPDTASLPALPEGWAWASADQVSAGEPYSLAIGPFGSSLKVSDYVIAGVPVVFVRNIRAASFSGADAVFVSAKKAEELKAHWVEAGDLLITKMGDPPGDVCVYPADRPRAVITADCIKLKPSLLFSDARFFAYAMEAETVHRQILGITKGVAQLKVSLGRFSTIAFALASTRRATPHRRRSRSSLQCR